MTITIFLLVLFALVDPAGLWEVTKYSFYVVACLVAVSALAQITLLAL